VKEIPAPASEEFARVIREVRFGISLEGALDNLSNRMENDDLQIVVTAIIINTQVGGNLSNVLESSIDTIRNRMQLLGEIRSLTSYSRFVGNMLSLLPLITGVALFFISRDYFEPVKTSLISQILLGMAFLMVLIGNFWLRRIVKVKV
jgi:tight adherence protein B